MAVKFAFAGFRHGHIFGLYNLAQKRDDIEVVAAAEDHEETRQSLASEGKLEVTHDSVEAMLDGVECDVVAVGDYYGRRGSIEIAALERGRHVIADKPLCTRLDELDTIERLSSERGLKVGLMLDMRDGSRVIGARNIIREGAIGEVHAISFNGQHPLMYGTRPGWYFEEGKHGGTINDIAIHTFDCLPWITGLDFDTVLAARCWNAFAEQAPHMKDAAQMMMSMSNGCGVLGDVSYFAPNSMGYSYPFYWRMTFWGRKGVLETSANNERIALALDGEKEMRHVELPPDNPGGYLDSFLADLAGAPRPGGLATADVLRASRLALTVQAVADENRRDVSLGC